MSKVIGKCFIVIELDCEKPEGYGIPLGQDVIQRIVMRDDILTGRVIQSEWVSIEDYKKNEFDINSRTYRYD